MDYIVPPGFEGNLDSKKSATDLVADLLNAEERWEIDEISDKIFKRILGRKSTRPIDAKTEKDLFLLCRQGDSEARNLLVFANLRLVASIARQFRPHKLTCNDIISEGLVGLIKAIDGYDIKSDYRFTTYAYKSIYYYIRNFLNTYLSLQSDIDTALKNLGGRDAKIIRLSFGIDCPVYTLEEIGMKFDLTRERIRQLRDRAIRKLRGKNCRDLKQYMGTRIL